MMGCFTAMVPLTGTMFCISYFFHCCDKIPEKNLVDETVILAPDFRGISVYHRV